MDPHPLADGPDADQRRRPRSAVFAILCAATAAYSILQSFVVPALGTFQRALHTTPAAVAWILTAFLLSASVLTPVLGRFADLYGKRRVLVCSLLAISAGAIVSGLADNRATARTPRRFWSSLWRWAPRAC